jgi:ABC-2 type transport system permease protein
VLAFALVRYRFEYQTGGGGRRRATVAVDEAPVRWTGITVPAAQRAFNLATRLRQLFTVAWDSFRMLHTIRGWLIVPFSAAVFVMTAPELLEVELGTPGAATSARVASMYGMFENALLIILLTALSAGELVWREREARISAIADVTPVPEWLTFLGKFLGLGMMLAAAQTILLLSGVAVQISQGVFDIDLGLYVKVLLGFELLAFLLVAAVAMVVHVLVNQKYVGNVLAVLVFIVVDVIREFGVTHHLLLYGRAPRWIYSDMSGFGLGVGPWLWFMAYWCGWALLFGVIAYLFWIRGEEGLRTRMARARQRLTRRPAVAGSVALAVIAGAGGFVFYNTNVLNPYRTDAQLDARRAEYERRYGKYASLPQPVLAATALHVDFHPKKGAASIRGSYRLENRSGVAIDAVHLVTSPLVETRGVSFDRPSRVTLADEDLGYRIYALAKALQPGESVRMNFIVDFAPRGFTNTGRNEAVLPNGSWFQHRGDQGHGPRQWLPFAGYQTSRELANAAVRREHGLPPRTGFRSLDNVAARSDWRGREKIALETIVGTDAGQIGVAPGELRRRWTENGRSYSHYVTDAPISNSYAIYSANYAVHRARWQDRSTGSGQAVEIEVLHHPTHTANLERIVRSVQASLDYHTKHYGPYPHRQLRLVEYRSSARGVGLTSFPGLIEYSEGFALVRPEADEREIDFPFAVMAHEMGHQWWGHQLVPARVEGAALLTESLAWYSALLTVEETLGRKHAMRILDIMKAEFLAPHQTREAPLLRASDRMDGYRIGPFAMFALQEALGADRVNAALRNLLSKFDPNRPPFPTSLDLYAELRAAAPPSMPNLLKDLFDDNTYWDLRPRRVEAQPAGSGAYRVTLHVDAHKLKSNAEGKEKPAPMNDLIEVAVFDRAGNPIYRKPHRIRSGEQTITVTVPRAPGRAGVDPDHQLLDREPGNNEAVSTERE